MKNILLALLCLFSFSLAAQVERMPSLSANYNAAQSGGGSGFWQLTGTFSDAAGIYDASGVAVGDVVFFSDGMYTFFLPVTEVVSATHPTLIVKVSNVGITQISSVPSGMKAIFHPTSKGYFPFVSGISNADQQNYNEYLMSLLDQAGGGKINKRYFADESNLDLTDSVDVLGSFNNVIIDIRRASGSGSVTLPVITDTLRHTIITVQAWVEDGGTNVGVFSGGESFVDGYAGGAFTDDPLLIVRNGEKVTLTPVFDGIWYWSAHITKPSVADGNGIISRLPIDSVGITTNNPLRLQNANGFTQFRDGKIVTNWKSDNIIISAYNNRPVVDDGAAVSIGCCEDSIMYGGVLVGMYSSLKKGGVGYFSTLVGYNSEADSTVKYTIVGTKNVTFGVRGDAAVIGNHNKFKASAIIGVGHFLNFNHDNSGLFGYGLSTDKNKQFKFGYGSIQMDYDFHGNFSVFDSIRNTLSFKHDSRVDTTFLRGTAVFGKASSLGSPTATGFSHIFRHPGSSSTAVLIESGRVSPTGGTAGIRLLPSGLWSSQIEYGSASSNALSFYSHKLGRNTLFLGSSGFVTGSPRTIIVGYSDDPGQWNGNAGLVVYDTITSGKGLFVVKKITTSSVPLATFSSASNDRFIINDNGDIQINSAYLLAKTAPSATSTVKSFMTWTGTGSGTTPAFETVNSAITGTARIIPYMNTGGRFVTGNTYFKIDTNTTSGAQARVRLLINNPNGDAGEGDSYSALSVRAGDGLGTEAIFNIGDQAATMGTTGYGSVMQLSRSGGNFTTKTNLSNGNEVGKFAWRGYVNGGSRALGHIQLNYVGDGTTYNSDLIGASAVSGSVVSGWKLDNQSRFWLGSGADDYHFPTTSPSNTTSDKNILIWTGTGSTPATPSFGTITGLMVDGQFTTGTPTLTAFGTGTAQRYVAVVELTSGASANTDIPLPTANVGTFGKSILISPRDLNTTYNINATGSIELNGASTASVILTKPTEFVCNVVSVGPTTYRWVMVDNATSSGSSSASTDGSGDVVITHNKNHTSYVVDIQGTGTTLGIGYTVTAKTATTFTVRAYDTNTKAAIASTGVTFDWVIKE